MIGGKSKAKRKAEERAERPPSRVESGTPSEHARPTPAMETDQDATLPKKTAAGQELPEVSPAAGGPSAAAAPAPEAHGERANRKREELKRQLETQSKAPTKKKRRF